MGKLVKVEIAVTEEAAAALADPDRAAYVGTVVSQMVAPPASDLGRLRNLIAEVKADARRDGLTDEDIDAELAAHKSERRF